MDAQEELKNLSVAFVMSLARPTVEMTDSAVAWQGVLAIFAASRIPGTITNNDGLQLAVARLKKLAAA